MSLRIKLLNYFRSRDRGFILSLFVATCLLYLPFLGNPFMFDDMNLFGGELATHYAYSSFHFDLRWLPYASLGWTSLLFSKEVTHLYHLFNLLLHVANVILLFYLLRRVMAAAIPEPSDSSAVVWGAWSGALIFALHPAAAYAVGYVVERSIVMATLFSLVMALAYLHGLLTGKARWLIVAATAYFLAVFSKEHSVLMPAMLAAMTVLLRAKIKIGKRVFWLVWGVFSLIGVLIVLRAAGVFGIPYEPMAEALFEQQRVYQNAPMLHLLSVLTQAGLYFKYLLLWLLPNPAWMSIDMREPFVTSLAAWQGWLGAAAFILYGVVGARLLLRGGIKGVLGLALLSPWLQFLLEFSTIRVQEPFVLYRSYLWMPGMMLLVPLLFVRWPVRRALLVLGVAVMLLAAGAANRLWVFADSYRLWNDAAMLLPNERAPGADRIFFNRGQAAERLGKWEDATADFERSL
ncbi:MAG TPA: hypothetical protein VFR06_09830, partial [Gallionellaceae bacterium]|nr:hypothetical protein [Gallionellaceae bacterium]